MAKGATRKQSRAPVKVVSMAALVGRYLLALGSIIGVLALVAVVGWKLSRLPIERVEVSGDLERVSRQEIEGMVEHALEGGFLGADLDVIREPLESLPWVYRVVIKRRWPSTLEIVVTGELPIARWGERGFLNHAGEVFEPKESTRVGELPRLSGPEGSQRQLMNHYKLLQQGLKPVQLQVSSLDMDERGGLRARLGSGEELVFGRADIENRLQRFVDIYRAELAANSGSLARVDLRYERGLAVAWRDSERRVASVGE